jgi:mycothiol synthase
MSTEAIPVAREFAGESDVENLARLQRAVVDADGDGLTVSLESIRDEWVHPEPGWVRTLQVWEAGDQFVASVGAWHEPADRHDRSYGELEVHPDWREPVFVDEVMAAALLAVSELVGRPVEHRYGAAGSQDWLQAGLDRSGFVADRTFYRMSASVANSVPEPDLPDGFTIRSLAGDAEVEEWVATFNAAFAGHYDPPTTTPDEKRLWMTRADYLPEADLVLTNSTGRIVGVGRNSGEVLEDGSRRGWINSVALRPEARGRGLGRALLLASMATLQRAGFSKVHLSVDTDNQTPALHLYTSAGFRVDSRMLVYRRTVDPI